MLSLGTPLRMMHMLAVESRVDIQLLQTTGKPMNLSTSKRNDHVTESNALAMSTLSNRQAWCLAWSNLAAECTNLKLSWMYHLIMKALWVLCMSIGSLGARQLAKILDTNLPMD
jgi:hypothetical protein